MFSFSAITNPDVHFSFSKRMLVDENQTPSLSRGIKRVRSLADVEGDQTDFNGRKKRRLRLVLITSRLSKPFSAPPTHIADRGSSKIAVWAKQKSMGRNVLRKSAILNLIKRQALEARQRETKQLELARQAYMKQTYVMAQIPRRQYIPLPPSPLGLSNYDALDADDEYDDGGSSDDECPSLSDDYTILDPAEPLTADYDSLDEIQPLPVKDPLDVPDNELLENLREKERQRELSFIFLG